MSLLPMDVKEKQELIRRVNSALLLLMWAAVGLGAVLGVVFLITSLT